MKVNKISKKYLNKLSNLKSNFNKFNNKSKKLKKKNKNSKIKLIILIRFKIKIKIFRLFNL